MNLDFYRNYIAIVENGTLSAAAEKLHVAQSALSVQVKQFESEYGTRLFLRSARHMMPTEAGRIVYQRAKDILALEEASHIDVEACIAGLQGTLRLGVTQAYSDPGMLRLLRSFQEENPRLHYEMFESDFHSVIEMLRSGVVELALIRSTTLLPPDLTKHVSVRQQQCVYWKKGSPWFDEKAETISLQELQGVPLAISRGFENTLRELFQRAEIDVEVMSVSTSRFTAAMWAESGAMAAIVCLERADSLESETMCCRFLQSDDPALEGSLSAVRSLVSIRGRVISAAASRFLRFSESFLAPEQTAGART